MRGMVGLGGERGAVRSGRADGSRREVVVVSELDSDRHRKVNSGGERESSKTRTSGRS
jgi:hypothetical protein